MKIIIGSDHAGYATKEHIKKFLDKKEIEYLDASPKRKLGDDYPDVAKKVVKEVLKSKNNKGILVCGTGTGMVMAANKFKGIRAALAYDNYTARMSRKDNDANVLALRGKGFLREVAVKLVRLWLNTPFSNKPRHKRRIKKLSRLK